MRKLKYFAAIVLAAVALSSQLFAQDADISRKMKVKSIYKFLDAKTEGIFGGWGKIKFGMQLAAFTNFFYTDYAGPGGRIFDLADNDVMLVKFANTDVGDSISGKPLREKGTQPIARYEFYFYAEKLFQVKVFFNETISAMAWEAFLDDRKREYGAPSSMSEAKGGTAVQENWAIWENDLVMLKLVHHFGEYDLTVTQKSAMEEIKKKAGGN